VSVSTLWRSCLSPFFFFILGEDTHSNIEFFSSSCKVRLLSSNVRCVSSCFFFAALHGADAVVVFFFGFGLATSDGVNRNVDGLLRFSQKRLPFIIMFLTILNSRYRCTQLRLKSSNGHFQQFILSFSFQNLWLQKVSFLFHICGFWLPIFYLFSLVIFVFLHFDLILLNALNRLF
jgi:hypothetical protein